MKTLPAILWLLFLLPGCSKNKTTDGVNADFGVLNGKSFLLQVNRAVKAPLMKLPAEALPESDYTVSVSGKAYTIVFSADGKTINLEPGTISGEKVSTGDDTICFYNLTEGIFAGGRFIARKVQEKLEGELTLYGSGVPIVLSERGSLLQGK